MTPIMQKIAKLLKLADQSKNASEAEASLAAAKVQELLQEHGLSLAEIGAAGGKADDGGREKREVDGYAINHAWQVRLMTAIAETSFCLCRMTERQTDRGRSKRFQLVGRKVNVDATRAVYDYLFETMRRMALEQGYVTRDLPTGKKDNKSHLDRKIWNEGCADRLAQRLQQRAQEAQAASARRRTQGNGTGKELVLSDVYGSEAELNNDTVNGFPFGTTAQRHREAEARRTAMAAKHAALVAQGVERIEAWYLANGYGAEDAKQAAESYNKPSHRRRGSGRGYRNYGTTSDRRKRERVNSEAYRAGARTGGEIGLDPQATHHDTKKLEG